jgi:hypothetical protein
LSDIVARNYAVLWFIWNWFHRVLADSTKSTLEARPKPLSQEEAGKTAPVLARTDAENHSGMTQSSRLDIVAHDRAKVHGI